ncbi:MAG: glycosyltransferase [Planctomycetales bacterium]|nr:glycosyltransferase [Planctomycetales bacterium]
MTTNELITVITPCRNAIAYIEQCIASVAAHGDLVAEHIVFDAVSDDGTTALLNAKAAEHPRLTVYTESDAGQSDALAKALRLVKTPFFAWLNADDYFVLNGLRHLTEALDDAADHGDVAIVYGDYVNVDADGQLLSLRKQPSFSYWDCVHGYLTVLNAAAIFNTELARQSGGFDVSLQFAMDYDLVLKMGNAGQVRHVAKTIAAFRRHADAKTTNLLDVYEKEIKQLRRKYSKLPAFLHPAGETLAKTRVIARMSAQGCLPCRLPYYNTKNVVFQPMCHNAS